MEMANRRTVVTVVVLGLMVAASSFAFNAQRRNQLTFNRAVALPGVQLGAGSYTFEVVEPGVGVNTVRVSNRNRVHFTGLTQTVKRPQGMDPKRILVFGESVGGAAAPIEMWFPLGETTGHRFLYSK
jgi:hypothetical protein